MAIVIPRARSSGALSIESNARNCASPLSASTDVMAAVSVVLPWSTCPIVPTFTCGLVLANLPFAIEVSDGRRVAGATRSGDPVATSQFWCPWRGSNARPLPYQGSALPLSHMGIDTGLDTRRDNAQTTDDETKKRCADRLERETGI